MFQCTLNIYLLKLNYRHLFEPGHWYLKSRLEAKCTMLMLERHHHRGGDGSGREAFRVICRRLGNEYTASVSTEKYRAGSGLSLKMEI